MRIVLYCGYLEIKIRLYNLVPSSGKYFQFSPHNSLGNLKRSMTALSLPTVRVLIIGSLKIVLTKVFF